MTTTAAKLEALFARIRTLPPERQEHAVMVLTELTEEEVYELSDEELAILEPALEAAKRGEFASDAEVNELLHKPWVKS
jgi:hypothetical protein